MILVDPAKEMNQLIAVTSSAQKSTLSTGVVFRNYPYFHRMMEAVNANYYKSLYLTNRYPSLVQHNFSSDATYANEQKLFRPPLPDEVFMYTYVHDNCAFIPTRNAKV